MAKPKQKRKRIRSDADVERALPGRTLTDLRRLYLHYNAETDLRSWVYRYSFEGSVIEKRIGKWPHMSYRTARDCAMAMEGLLLDRKNPVDPREAVKWNEKVQKTFKEAADEWVALQKQRWSASHLYNAELMLHRHLADLSKVQVYKINRELVDKAISKLRKEHPVQAKRTVIMCAKVLDYCEFKGYRSGSNPARWKANMEFAFPSMRPAQPHRYIHFLQMPNFMQDLRIKQERSTSAVALEFLILTGARTQQVLEAKSSEIDFENQLWNLTYDRMKARKAYRVPLSARALELLERQRQCSTGSPYIFTGYGGQTPLSKKSLYRIAPELTTVHGFRSTIRTWAGENGFPWDVCEMALAHSVGGRVAQAYWHGEQLEQRRKLMEAWSSYCEGKVSTPSTAPDLRLVISS
jgi:integrase